VARSPVWVLVATPPAALFHCLRALLRSS
jgi:hypothetical protein